VEPRPVSHSHAVLVHWLGPTDLNPAGFVHGGVIMKLCDQVAGLAGVRVEAERPAVGTVRHTNSAYLTMVAVDHEGHPRPVPPLTCENEDERRREAAARTRRRNRLAEREEIVGGRS
jgi:acyl-CoA hydrolase